MKITLKTIPDISHSDWQAQSQRFTKGDTKLLQEALPVNTENSAKVIIEVLIKQPLIDGFKGEVSYIQTYTQTIENPVLNPETFEPTGQMETVEQTERKTILKYIETVPFEEIDTLLQQVDALIDSNVIGLNRQKQAVAQAILLNAVSKTTFGGLDASQYEIIID